MIFRQLFDRESCTYTYLLADEASGEAVLIDPVREQIERDEQVLADLGLTLKYSLETHVHADHVTAAGLWRQRVGSKAVVGGAGGAPCADVLVGHGDVIHFGGQSLEVRCTPGHTAGCVVFVDHVERRVFSGDTLLIRGCGRTDFQQGSADTLYRSVHEQLFTLPDDYAVYPGHDYKGRTASSIGEEKQHNGRLGQGRSLAEFRQIMATLKLSQPRKMDLAVPANLQCGLLPGDECESWAPIQWTGSIPEVRPAWVAANATGLQVVDVRQAGEFEGELGRVAGARLAPLDQLRSAAAAWDRSAPIVVVCRSGSRSGRAVVGLLEQGFERVVSMSGGMLAWNDLALPIERGPVGRQSACG